MMVALPFCYAVVLGLTCVVLIAAVTVNFEQDMVLVWLAATAISMNCKWWLVDPLKVCHPPHPPLPPW